jgi:tetratricopeptide (TPR) repeat protein
MDLLSQAIALDPCYAAAYARLASTLAQLGFWGHVPMAEAYPRAKELARKAIALDEALSEAHDSLAWATWLHDWDLDTCEREIDRAIALNPSNENGAIMRATFRAVIHRDCAGAQEEARRALEIGPLSLLANACVAWVYLFTRDWAKASEQATATLDMFPESLQARYVLGLARLGEGRLGEAVAELRTAAGLSDDSMSLGYLAHVSARAGDSGTARGILAQLLDRHRSAPVATRSIVMTCAALGELDTAFEWLERAYAERDGQLFFVPNVLVFDPLRADPRFARLIARVRRAARTASRPPPRRASR